ncbi:protein WVD2-like 7 isoform X2 [Punica granatum]|uniref:Protein WVD2-like 7 isoform X2 n=1 Tax=Punica granatum TaxID=22663 RepID=A0A6P8CKD5_PUNGR|nr:protein WVD2-like 7 isoform X2 [Punica granatum]
MGEPACLLRSFSHPSDASYEVRKGDPARALTDSVSFGRFMSESLAWEKWSAFSHNRYLEEVEKFAKPGSVAQKKAYFEAHYRKKAALREASNVEEPSSEADVETPTTGLESVESENRFTCDEQPEDDSMDKTVDASLASADVPMQESKFENVEVTSSGPLEQGAAVEDLAVKEDSTQMHKSDECIEIRNSERETVQEEKAADPETSTSTGGKKRVISSSKSLDKSKASKLLLPRAKGIPTMEKGNGKDSAPSREKSVIEKRKSASKSLHRSINFPSSTVSTSKPLSPVLQQIKKLKDITASLKLQQDSSSSRKIPTRASVNVTSKISSALKPEERRTKTSLNKSVAGRLMTEKTSSSTTKENSKLSFTSGSNVQSPVVCSPFRFRSEERAAKRREKQEEKINAKEEAERAKPHQRYRFLNGRPQSPKLAKKATPVTGPETKPRPPRQKTTVKVENANHAKGKSTLSTRASVPSFIPRNNVRENSSPNIPR